MGLRDFFTRKKKKGIVEQNPKNQNGAEIVFETAELKAFVKNWLENNKWKLEDFSFVMEEVGVNIPAKVCQFEKWEKCFKCYTELDKEYEIYLGFGEICVTRGEETRKFNVKYKIDNGNAIQKVVLHNRTIKKNGKVLSSEYYHDLCLRTLKLDENHVLHVKVDKPNGYDDKRGEFALTNCQQIEDYLLGLDISLVTDQVYEKILGFFGFSEQDVSNSKRVLVSFNEIIEGKEYVLSIIFRIYGKMQEYAVFENGEVFHVFKDGGWRYQYNNITIVYIQERKECILQIVGTESDIAVVNNKETMDRVKEKISELWKFVK